MLSLDAPGGRSSICKNGPLGDPYKKRGQSRERREGLLQDAMILLYMALMAMMLRPYMEWIGHFATAPHGILWRPLCCPSGRGHAPLRASRLDMADQAHGPSRSVQAGLTEPILSVRSAQLDQLILPYAQPQRCGGFHGVDAVPGLHALDQGRLAGIGRSIDRVHAGLVDRHRV